MDNATLCTWAEWRASNADDMDERDFAEIAAAIRDPSCKCIMGNSAAALSYVSRADINAAAGSDGRRDLTN